MPNDQEMYQLAQNVARLEARFDGVEREIKQLRVDLKESMGTIQSTLKELALFNERLVHNANEHTHIHSRTDENEDRLDELETAVDSLNRRVEAHSHCGGCQNDKRIEELERRVDHISTVGRDMLKLYKLIMSKPGAIILAVTAGGVVLAYYHTGLLKPLFKVFGIEF